MKLNVSWRPLTAVLAAAVLLSGAALQAAPKLPAFFTTNMVLQRDKPVPVWGQAEAGENVTVTFNGQTLSAVAQADGQWSVNLKPMKGSAKNQPFTVAGDKGNKPIVLNNVVVGDVWICSGQSNMEYSVNGCTNKAAELAAANYPLIRHIKFGHTVGDTPTKQAKCGSWTACSPKQVGGFTAVGYFFGRTLHKELNVPIGLISTNWGGTRVEPWTAPEGFRLVPELKSLADMVDATLPSTATGKAAYLKALAAAKEALPKIEEAIKNGTPVPAMPTFPTTGTSHQSPTRIYNTMISPLIPYAIRGAIWYQGESNGGEGVSYFHKKRALIEGWRKLWNQGDFPFYFVQLANYRNSGKNPAGGDGWAKLREAQRQCLTIPNTGMAVIIDIGEAGNIHPKNKQDVGDRLARWALAKEFGQDIVCSGPLYKTQTVEGSSIRVDFDYVGSGLMVGKKEGLTPTTEVKNGTLTHFAIAGEDKVWHWAKATIKGASVLVSSDKVAKPVAVRYAYRMNPVGCNLYNLEGLPASPFRTDTW